MAVGWYALNNRVHPAPTPGQAMLDMVRAWAYDVAEGKDALLVAYHRDAVERLNAAARLVWQELGHLFGPELEAEGGRRYRAGDRVVTLSPGRDGAWVTSQRAVVSSVDLATCSLVAVTPEGPSCTWAQATSGPTGSLMRTALPPTAPRARPWTPPTPWKMAGAETGLRGHEQGQARATCTWSPLTSVTPPTAWPGPGVRKGGSTGPIPSHRRSAWPACTTNARSCGAYFLRTARPTSTRRGASCVRSSRTPPTCTQAPAARPIPFPGMRPGTSTKRRLATSEPHKTSKPATLGLGTAQSSPSAERVIGSLRPGHAGRGAARPTICRPAGGDPGTAHTAG